MTSTIAPAAAVSNHTVFSVMATEAEARGSERKMSQPISATARMAISVGMVTNAAILVKARLAVAAAFCDVVGSCSTSSTSVESTDAEDTAHSTKGKWEEMTTVRDGPSGLSVLRVVVGRVEEIFGRLTNLTITVRQRVVEGDVDR